MSKKNTIEVKTMQKIIINFSYNKTKKICPIAK